MYAIIEDGAHQFQVEPGQATRHRLSRPVGRRRSQVRAGVGLSRRRGAEDRPPHAGIGHGHGQGRLGRPGPQVGRAEVPRAARTSAAAPATGRFSPAWSSTRSRSADAASVSLSLRERVGVRGESPSAPLRSYGPPWLLTAAILRSTSLFFGPNLSALAVARRMSHGRPPHLPIPCD